MSVQPILPQAYALDACLAVVAVALVLAAVGAVGVVEQELVEAGVEALVLARLALLVLLPEFVFGLAAEVADLVKRLGAGLTAALFEVPELQSIPV